MIEKVKSFFSPEKRKAIYGIVAAASIALVAFGILSQEDIDSATTTVTQVITALVTLMAFVNTSGD